MNHPKPVRVAVAIAQAISRRGLVSILTSLRGFQVVGEARDCEEALQLCELVEPELLILDSSDLSGSNLDVLLRIYERWPQTRVVLLTSDPQDKPALADPAYQKAHFISKDLSEEEIETSLNHVMQSAQVAIGPENPYLAQGEYVRQLSYELNNASLDYNALSDVLSRYLPLIFPESQIVFRLFPNHDLYVYPEHLSSQLLEQGFRWVRTTSQAYSFLPHDSYPWGGRQPASETTFIAPIRVNAKPAGGIFIANQRISPDTPSVLSVIQSLADRVSITVETIQKQNAQPSREVIARELSMAGRIQADILPEKAPTLPGWDIAVQLESARETSGDFYDFIPLTNNSWGIVVGDVTDKGIGAALFMALSNTLIRTYAVRYPTLPALTMSVVNERILSDTRGSMFVTAFYCVLETHTGRMRYVNGGHPAPLLVSQQKGKPVDLLSTSGMALGIMEEAHWTQKITRISPGDIMVMYTDGISEAQNPQGEYFGEHHLMEIVRARNWGSAQSVAKAILDEVHHFVGDSPPQDDIAIIVIRRRP